MLQPLQISTSALQPYQDQKPQQNLRTLPEGSSVYARLTPAGLFERAELHSVHPTAPMATVTAFSSGRTAPDPLGSDHDLCGAARRPSAGRTSKLGQQWQ